MAELSIRPCTAADRDLVVELWRRCDLLVWYNDPERDLQLFQDAADAEVFLGFLGAELVASACAGFDGHRGWLYYVATDPRHRRHGFASRMVRHAEDWLRARLAPKVQLIVRDTNREAERFYRALGFERSSGSVLQRWLRDLPLAASPVTEPVADDSGKLECTITFLEMTERPRQPAPHPPPGAKVALLRARAPTVAFYRFLYDNIGRRWLWHERRRLTDAALEAIVKDELVEIYVLYVEGVPAGYGELDRRGERDIDLAYFGLMPEFIGHGLGSYLLGSVVDLAWGYEPARLLVNTNTLDHPGALPLYQRHGFRPYRRVKRVIEDPRLNGLIES